MKSKFTFDCFRNGGHILADKCKKMICSHGCVLGRYVLSPLLQGLALDNNISHHPAFHNSSPVNEEAISETIDIIREPCLCNVCGAVRAAAFVTGHVSRAALAAS